MDHLHNVIIDKEKHETSLNPPAPKVLKGVIVLGHDHLILAKGGDFFVWGW